MVFIFYKLHGKMYFNLSNEIGEMKHPTSSSIYPLPPPLLRNPHLLMHPLNPLTVLHFYKNKPYQLSPSTYKQQATKLKTKTILHQTCCTCCRNSNFKKAFGHPRCLLISPPEQTKTARVGNPGLLQIRTSKDEGIPLISMANAMIKR